MNPDRVTFAFHDCGCSAKWSGDELVIRPCDQHRDQDRGRALDVLATFAGPPTYQEPPPIPGRVNYGDN